MWEIWSDAAPPYGDMSNAVVIVKVVEDNYRLPRPAGCPVSIYTIATDCWHKV